MKQVFIGVCVVWLALIAVCFTPLLPAVGFFGGIIFAFMISWLSGLARFLGLPMESWKDPAELPAGVLILLVPIVGLLLGIAAWRASTEFRRNNDQAAYGWLSILVCVVGFGVTTYVGIIPFLQDMQRLN